ncbi:F-box/kelch-repeat protein At4g39590-like [Cornus florida]|uniref:F-box/kelch-repeat protein At4g39590-like n=1 Tax=Cornus florida TaxID=4283 RepID=UPI00289CCEBD|nr:F-box/kelch-repeat protein At4g39590-like [Cornus florida]
MSGWSWIPLDDDDEVAQRENSSSSNEITIEIMHPGVPNLFTAVAFGSLIYLIGGRSCCSIYHAKVFYFDTAHPHQGWKEGPSMITGQSEPSVVVVLGKIYVFGGMDIDKLPYAEVLNPTLNRWEELPEPPHYLPKIVEPVHALLSDGCDNRRILIHPCNTRAFFSYNIDTGSWDVFDEWFFDNWSERAVAVNGVLYYCVHSNVYAYELLERKRFTKSVRDFKAARIVSRLRNLNILFLPICFI